MRTSALIFIVAITIYGGRCDAQQTVDQQPTQIRKALDLAHASGFLDARIIEDSLVPGSRFLWGKIDLIDSLNVLSSIRFDSLINHQFLEDQLLHGLDLCVNKGHPFCRIAFKNITYKDSIVNGQIIVHPGPLITFDTSSQINGTIVSRLYLDKFIGINQGAPYDWSAMQEVDRTLKKVRFLKITGPSKVSFVNDKAHVLFDIKKKNSSSLDAIVGILPQADGKLLFTGDVDMRLMNALKLGESMNLQWQRLDTSSQRLEVGYDHPYIGGSSLGIGLNLNIYKRSEALTFEGDASLHYMLRNANYVGGYIERRESSTTDTSAIAISAQSNSGGIKLLINGWDTPLNPSRGFFVKSKFGAGQRTKNYKALPVEVSTQLQGKLDAKIFIPITAKHVFMLREKVGYVSSNSPLLKGELLRISGANGQRGFDEEQLFGSLFTTSTVEYRFRFEELSFARGFFDLTYFKDLNRVSDTPYGFGVGIAIGTAAGIISLDYALGTEQGNPILLKTGKVHVGFTGLF